MMKSGVMKRRMLLWLALCAGLLTPPALAQSGSTAKQRPRAPVADAFFYRDSPAAMAFADDMAVRRHLDAAWVRDQIGQARRSAAAIRGVTPAPVGVPVTMTSPGSSVVKVEQNAMSCGMLNIIRSVVVRCISTMRTDMLI